MADSGSTFFPQALGIAMIIVHTGILMSVVLYGVRRWALPPGSVTLIFTVNAVALTAMRYGERFGPFLAIAQVLAGVNADALIPKVPSIRFHKKYEKFKPKRLCQNF